MEKGGLQNAVYWWVPFDANLHPCECSCSLSRLPPEHDSATKQGENGQQQLTQGV